MAANSKVTPFDVVFTVGAAVLGLAVWKWMDIKLAYEADEPDVVPDYYPPIRPTHPEESENDIRSHRWSKKYGCRKLIAPDGKWWNQCTGVGDAEGIRIAPPDDPFNDLGIRPTYSTYAHAYAVNDDEPPIQPVNASRFDPITNISGDPSRRRPLSYKDCIRGGAHEKCCAAAQGDTAGITQEEFDNCRMCGHINCQHFSTQGFVPGSMDDPTLPPFQLGSHKIALQDIGFKDKDESNYAYAYAAGYGQDFYS